MYRDRDLNKEELVCLMLTLQRIDQSSYHFN